MVVVGTGVSAVVLGSVALVRCIAAVTLASLAGGRGDRVTGDAVTSDRVTGDRVTGDRLTGHRIQHVLVVW